MVTAVGEKDLAEIQVNAALHNGELSEDELREMAIFLTHYVGFPLGSGLNAVVEKVIARRNKAAAAGKSEDKKANVAAVLDKQKGE
nr:4-carboxymuconolactone decarboxylase [Mycolicibacter nonchromogenicus]